MSVSVLVWTVPVVATVAALVVLLTQMRKLEDLCVGLARDVGRIGELRRPLAEVRHEMDCSEPVVSGVWSHWEHEESPAREDDPNG